ncbi:MAG: RagB/SusD family nutrient uptake outer membrane protein, partial [Bacteroidetes bacterium]|nr:RagB/SusD family nutrient uptake outer membrane protein [Bacteroidota bacterium]
MMKIKNIIIIGILFSAFGCTDLEEEVYDRIPVDIYPENDAQVASLPLNAYKELQPLIDDQGWWFLAQETSSDELVFPTRDADWDDGGKWRVMHQHNWTNDVEGVNRMWDVFYNGVTKSNQTIDMMKELEQTDIIKEKIKEVETVRCFYYYLIIDNYGDAPYLTTTIGVPEQPNKISRAAIFDSVTTTLENNLSSLKAIDNKLLATRYMAFALLSKLYLNAEVYTGTAQWEKAGQYADSIINGPYTLANNVTEPFVTQNENSTENIFTIPFDEDTYEGFRLHMRTLHYQSNLTFDMPVGPWNGCAVMYDHFLTYDTNDLRREAYFLFGPQVDSKGDTIIESVTEDTLVLTPEIPALLMDASYTPAEIRTSGARIKKYEIAKGAKENLSNDFPLFRLTDFYLVKAEVEIRQNGPGAGDDWINEIRLRAGLDEWNGATLEQLLAERGRE